MGNTRWGDGATTTVRLDQAITRPAGGWGGDGATYTVLDAPAAAIAAAATPTPATRPGAGECFKVALATCAVVGLGAVLIALGNGAPFLDAVRGACVWAGAAGAGAWAALLVFFIGADLGRSFEVRALARIKVQEIEANKAIELRRLELQAATDRERTAATKDVSIAELEHTGRLREAHARHFELTAGQTTTSEPIEDPLRALVQTLLLDAYKPSSQDADGSGRLIDGIISRDKVMKAGFTKTNYEDAKRKLETSGVLTYGQDKRWRLDRLRFPTPQDGYRAIFGAEW